ncbi:hypothetical protein EYC84_001958 [Monilinia fructicola]|uniref:Uncharacterized protein n=2 Tax=Monilinia TaxID=38447 RepID=A0A5M9JR97_MONFR|nr:hypothetical protein EYC84_001958 [Monilinia fructicola]
MASPPSPPYDTIEDPMSSQKMMRNNSIPEPSESPKSQLHDAIERIQSLHKRRAQIKTIYENERQYLDQRSQKTKSSFEGLIVSTEEQIQSINEFPAFDSHPDYTEVNGKLHSVALDTKALFQNRLINARMRSRLRRKITSGPSIPGKISSNPAISLAHLNHSNPPLQSTITVLAPLAHPTNFKTVPILTCTHLVLVKIPTVFHKSDTITSHNNVRPQNSRSTSMDMSGANGMNMSGGNGMNGGVRGNGNGNGNGDVNYPPNSSEKRSGGKKKTFSWLSGGSGNGKYIE